MYGRFRVKTVSESSKMSPGVSGARPRKVLRPRLVPSVDTEARPRHGWLFVTYSRCFFTSNEQFQEQFCSVLRRNNVPLVRYYGCRWRHPTEGSQYHVLVRLEKQPGWSCDFMKSAFSLEGGLCGSFVISTPLSRSEVPFFIEKCVCFMEQPGGYDYFGDRPVLPVHKRKNLERVSDRPTASSWTTVAPGDYFESLERHRYCRAVSSLEKMRVSFVVEDL